MKDKQRHRSIICLIASDVKDAVGKHGSENVCAWKHRVKEPRQKREEKVGGIERIRKRKRERVQSTSESKALYCYGSDDDDDDDDDDDGYDYGSDDDYDDGAENRGVVIEAQIEATI